MLSTLSSLSARGTECHMLTREEIEDRCPLLQTEDLAGAMWVPHDGVCHPYKLTRTLMQIANKKGVFRQKLRTAQIALCFHSNLWSAT